MINNTTLVGRLTKEPDLKYTSNGQAVATFTLAVNRNFTNQNGEREADFINCVIWRKSAETLANYARKGTLLSVVGRIQTRSYENQQGQRVYVTEVVCENFRLLGSRSANASRNSTQASQNSAQGFAKQNETNYPPKSQNGVQSSLGGVDPFRDVAGVIDIPSDDLPF